VDHLIFLISVIFILAFFTWMKPAKVLVEILVLIDLFKEEFLSFAC